MTCELPPWLYNLLQLRLAISLFFLFLILLSIYSWIKITRPAGPEEEQALLGNEVGL